MNFVLKISLLLCFFLNAHGYQTFDSFRFNTDVVVCQNSVHSLTLIEQKILFPGKPLNLFTQKRDGTFIQKNLQDLLNTSPQRAIFLADLIANKIPHISYQTNIQLTRHSPVSALIVPKDCHIEPIALTHISTSSSGFTSYINKDLFLKMTLQDQFLSLMELGLDAEQGIDGLRKAFANPIDYSAVPFDLVQSREFLRCWYSSFCRPTNLSIPQAHEIFRKFNLSFIEQAGILIPNPNVYETYPSPKKYGMYSNGFVSYTDKTLEKFPPLEKYFNSKVVINNANSDFSNHINTDNHIKDIVFANNGNIQCLPIRIDGLFPNSKKGVPGAFNNKIYLFVESPIYANSYPVCFNQLGQVTQGFIPFQSLIEIPFQNPFVNGVLTSWDDYNKRNFGVFIRMHKNGSAHLLFEFKGLGTLQNKKLPIKGPLKLRPDGSVECAEVSEATTFKTNKLQNYRHDPKTKSLLCFNEQQLLVSVIPADKKSLIIRNELPPY